MYPDHFGFPGGAGMMFQKNRYEAFIDWPYPPTAPCSAANLAAAGFYPIISPEENNVAACWVCHKQMFWDEDDDPKKEHINHCPDCLFVKIALNKKEKDLTFGDLVDLFSASGMNYKAKYFYEVLRKFAEGKCVKTVKVKEVVK